MVTQVTGTVLANVTIEERHIANNALNTQHFINGAITADKLAANANTTAVQANLTALISGNTEFTVSKTFQQDVIVQGNLYVEGSTVTFNISTLVVEDKNIQLNHNGTNSSAEGSGLQVTGTSNILLTNLTYVAASNTRMRLANTDTANTTAQDDILTVRSLWGYQLRRRTNTNISLASSNVFFIGGTTPTDAANIEISTDGLVQPNTAWIFNSGNNTIQLTEPSFPANISVHISVFTP